MIEVGQRRSTTGCARCSPEALVPSAPPIGLAGFRARAQDDVPGFNVGPQDGVPGFNLDEDGVPRREKLRFDRIGPGSATLRYSDSAQTLVPPGAANPVQPFPPPPPEWLHKVMTMPLPSLSNAFDPASGRRIVRYAPLVNPVRYYPATDQNVRGMGDPRAGILQTTPPLAVSRAEEPRTELSPPFDVPKPPADISGPYGIETARNFNPWPTGQEAMESRWSMPSEDGEPSEQGTVNGLQGQLGSEMVQQGAGALPAPFVGPADPNFVLANADGDEVQEVQQGQRPSGNTSKAGPQGQPVQGKRQPSAPPKEKSGEDLTRLAESRREEALNEVRYKVRREERASYWDSMLRAQPISGDGIQKPLSSDWRADVRRIHPSYVDYTEAAAKKRGIPPELLARLLYRESNYKNKGVDRDGNPLRGRAIGIPQMYPDALKDVGVDPETFGKAGAAAQIDAAAAYLAMLYRRFGDWPRTVAAYQFGYPRIEAWSAGKGPPYESIVQRKTEESAYFRGKTEKAKKGQEETVKDREAEVEKQAKPQMDQWAELKAYLPYIFLGNPSRYD